MKGYHYASGAAEVLILLIAIVRICKSCDCLVNQLGPNGSGNVTSPNYPNPYPDRAHCTFKVAAEDPNKQIKLTFLDFNVEESNDCSKAYLVLENEGQYDLGNPLCGTTLPPSLTSPNNVLIITFLSNSKNNRATGFHLEYEIIDKYDPANCRLNYEGDDAKLNKTISFASPGHRLGLPYPEFVDCLWEVESEEGSLIQVTFDPAYRLEDSPHCTKDFVHVGNGKNKIGYDSPTSYKFCGETLPHEIVSRSNYLWIQFKSDFQLSYSGFKVTLRILPPDPCRDKTGFQCSPVQCIHTDRVCDHAEDCNNGIDEYCDSASNKANLCLKCLDDTACIAPQLMPYDDNYGKPYWWLCDGIQHCKDGTDELLEICHTLQSRVGTLFVCDSSLESSYMILDKLTCDGQPDCSFGEDEAEELCKVENGKKSGVKAEYIAIPIAVAVVVLIVLAAIYILSQRRNQRLKRRKADRQKRLVTLNSANSLASNGTNVSKLLNPENNT